MAVPLITLRRGDDFSWAAAFKVGTAALDLTGYTISADARFVNGVATQIVTATVVDAMTGLVSLTISDADTTSMQTGIWSMQVRITTPAGLVSSSGPTYIEVRL